MSHTAFCFLYPHAHIEGDEMDALEPELGVERTRSGLKFVGLSLFILALTAAAQAAVFVVSGSVALLADLIHNVGDALTAVPVGAAFLLRSARAERYSGLGVVIAILISAFAAAYAAVERLVDPEPVTNLVALAVAGALGFAGNWLAAEVRTRGGRRLRSPALIADGAHAAADAYVSLAAVGSAVMVGLGWRIADPLLALAVTTFIVHIAWEAWHTVSGAHG